jgi:hypothetical protein
MVYLTAKQVVKLVFVGFQEKLSGFDRRPLSKSSDFPLLSGAEPYQSLETALTTSDSIT